MGTLYVTKADRRARRREPANAASEQIFTHAGEQETVGGDPAGGFPAWQVRDESTAFSCRAKVPIPVRQRLRC